jgi:hypothetical protein
MNGFDFVTVFKKSAESESVTCNTAWLRLFEGVFWGVTLYKNRELYIKIFCSHMCECNFYCNIVTS